MQTGEAHGDFELRTDSPYDPTVVRLRILGCSIQQRRLADPGDARQQQRSTRSGGLVDERTHATKVVVASEQ
jgi:hypothetical protein